MKRNKVKILDEFSKDELKELLMRKHLLLYTDDIGTANRIADAVTEYIMKLSKKDKNYIADINKFIATHLIVDNNREITSDMKEVLDEMKCVYTSIEDISIYR